VADKHEPTARLTGELARLRAQARLIVSTYLPGPARAAELRANELAQRALHARLRALLGDRPVFGGVRAAQAPGTLRAAWTARW